MKLSRSTLFFTLLLTAMLFSGCADNASDITPPITSDSETNETSIYSDTDTTANIDNETTNEITSETLDGFETEFVTNTEPETVADAEIITEPLPPPEPKGSLVSLSLSKENNPALAHDLDFTIDEDTLTATLTLNYQNYADAETLMSAVLSADAENGNVSFPAITADGGTDLLNNAYCTVTDNDGIEKVYTIKIDRTVYSLPIVNITLNNGKAVDTIDRDITTDITFSLDAAGADGYESVGNMSGTIRGRGNSTWKWDKKPYKIKLDSKISLLGLTANKDWILLANYADKSLLRNTLAYEMGRVLDSVYWSPHQYPVDLFVNGEYRGVYSLGEHMEVAKGRVNIDEGNSVDTGYLIEIGGMDETVDVLGTDYFHTKKLLVRFATFISPDADEITNEQKEYITDYFDKTEAAIISGEGYEEYIDVDSFVDWILLHELSYNLDSCFRRSCYLTKEAGEKLKMGPIWDFDLAFGNLSRDNKNYDDLITVGVDDKDAYVKTNWCTYLLKDPEFCQMLQDRWRSKRDELLAVAFQTIDTYSALIYPSQEENFKVWDIWDERAGYQSKWCAEADSYPEQIEYLKNFLTKRAEWMDNNLPSGESQNTNTEESSL